MILRERIAKGVAWTVIQNVAAQSISLGVFFLLARLLEPKDFGLVALAVVFTDFLGVFLYHGFPAAIVQRRNLDPEHLDTAFWVTLSAGVVLMAVTIGASGLVAKIFKQPQVKPIVIWLSLNFLLKGLNQTQAAVLRRRLALNVLAASSVVSGLIGGLVAVTMALLGYGVWSIVSRQLTTELFLVLILWPACRWSPRFKFSLPHLKELFSFGVNMMGSNILRFLNRRTDDMLIGYFLGPVELGYYTVAYRLLLKMTRLWGQIVGNVAFPAFSRIQKDLVRLREMFYSATRLTSLVAFPVFFGILALVPELVPTLFGDHWTPSIPVMQVLTFVCLLHSILSIQSTVMVGVGKPSWHLGLQALVTIANIIGFAIAVRWGIVAVAISYAVVGYSFAPFSFWLVRRLITVDIANCLRLVIPAAMGTTIMLSCIYLFKFSLAKAIPDQIVLASCMVIGGLVYIMAIRFFAPLVASQTFHMIRSVFSRS